MKAKTATLIGATGLIGSHVLQLLQQDAQFQTIKVLSRRPLHFDDPKVQVIVLDFADDNAFREAIAGSDAVFCSVGTTQQKVKGDMTAYRKVDYDIPVRAVQFCAATGCPHFLLVSSVGADSTGRNFYIKLKGEVEDAVLQVGIPHISIFRPSMLLGQRGEFRLGERIGQILMSALAFMIPANYKPVQAHHVAEAMLAAERRSKPGAQIYHFREIMELAKTG